MTTDMRDGRASASSTENGGLGGTCSHIVFNVRETVQHVEKTKFVSTSSSGVLAETVLM